MRGVLFCFNLIDCGNLSFTREKGGINPPNYNRINVFPGEVVFHHA